MNESKQTVGGYRVTDSRGVQHVYPTALAAEINDEERLLIFGSDTEILAIFNRRDWEHVERQAA